MPCRDATRTTVETWNLDLTSTWSTLFFLVKGPWEPWTHILDEALSSLANLERGAFIAILLTNQSKVLSVEESARDTRAMGQSGSGSPGIRGEGGPIDTISRTKKLYRTAWRLVPGGSRRGIRAPKESCRL